jgi:hypothetical protein
MGLLLVVAVFATLGLLGHRAATGAPSSARGLRRMSTWLPVWLLAAGFVMLELLGACEITDVCSGDSCEKCEVQGEASEPIFYGYLAIVGLIWLASVLDGFGDERSRQARRLKLAVRVAVAVPILFLVAFVLFHAF